MGDLCKEHLEIAIAEYKSWTLRIDAVATNTIRALIFNIYIYIAIYGNVEE